MGLCPEPARRHGRPLSPALFDACSATAEPAGPCFGGLDLSAGPTDLTSFALYWPETGALRVWAFLPSASIFPKEREDKAPYRQWQAAGHVVEMPGKAILAVAEAARQPAPVDYSLAGLSLAL